MRHLYEPNPKHKRGARGGGPLRWFPTRDSLCSDHNDRVLAEELLEHPVQGEDASQASGTALFALHQGEFFKAYRAELREGEDGEHIEVWHGFPVRRELVGRQVPARVLRTFLQDKRLTRAEYRRLLRGAP